MNHNLPHGEKNGTGNASYKSLTKTVTDNVTVQGAIATKTSEKEPNDD